MTDLAARLIGSWDLQSRSIATPPVSNGMSPGLAPIHSGSRVFDRTGHFAAQFMKRDRKSAVDAPTTAAAVNNSFARGGYDAYFGTYSVDREQGRCSSVRSRREASGRPSCARSPSREI